MHNNLRTARKMKQIKLKEENKTLIGGNLKEGNTRLSTIISP
jgi:hypothetical protein